MSFYADFAPHYERIFPLREVVLDYLRARLPAPPARVLDAGCGPGHHCGRLAAEGWSPIGLDLDAAMIDAARAAYPAAEFHVLDLAGIDALPGALDAAFCLGNVAPHLDRERLGRVLDVLRDRLPVGAPWLVQTVNWDALPLRDGYAFPPRDLDGAVFEREYAPLEGAAVRFRTRLRIEGEVVFAGEETLYPLAADDVAALHAERGFELSEHHADFAGAPFAPERPGGSVMAFRRR